MVRVMAMLLAAGLLTGQAHADEPSWARVGVGEHPISVLLPGSIKREHEENSSFGGPVVNDTVSSGLSHGWASATVSAAPPFMVSVAGNSLIFTTTKQTILNKAGGRLLDWTTVVRNGLEGRRLHYEVKDDVRGLVRGIAEVYVKDSLIVTLHARVPSEAEAAEAERFFASVEIPGPTP